MAFRNWLCFGFVTVAFLAASCDGGGGGEVGVDEVRSEKQRIVNPQVSPGDLQELVAGEQAFALDLNAQLASEDEGNLFHSPLSIFEVMGMLWGGARTETETEMADVLHFNLPQERFHPALNALDLALASRGQGASGTDGEPFRLRVVNALWGQQGYPFAQEYLDLIALNYGAGMFVVDFKQPEDAANRINDWCAQATEGKIEKLISPSILSPETVLVLTNAIYFNASWAEPFDEALTHPADFHLADGTSVQVDMMQNPLLEGGYVRLSNLEAVEIPYDGQEVSMVVILPEAGQFEQVESQLDSTLLQQVLSGLESATLDLSLPKFGYRTDYKLKTTLQALGLERLFDPGRCDLSGMNDGIERLYVAQVIHKTFLSVDEAGTEAAAATAAVVVGTSAPAADHVVVVDRPFLFFIRDIETGAILFMGSVRNPAS